MLEKNEISEGLINTQNNFKKYLKKIHRTMVVGTMMNETNCLFSMHQEIRIK